VFVAGQGGLSWLRLSQSKRFPGEYGTRAVKQGELPRANQVVEFLRSAKWRSSVLMAVTRQDRLLGLLFARVKKPLRSRKSTFKHGLGIKKER